MLDTCKHCGLYTTGMPDRVPPDLGQPGLLLIGEAPGSEEVNRGRPFSGMSGRDLDHYLYLAGVPRARWSVTNVVKCRPPKNRDPYPDEILSCRRYLQDDIEKCSPRVIGTLGRFAARVILGDNIDMESVHGIPFRLPSGCIVVPCYHPAMGIHAPSSITDIYNDFKSLCDTVKKTTTPRGLDDDASRGFTYEHIQSPGRLLEILDGRSEIAIDTESRGLRGSPWCLTFCVQYGHGYLIRETNTDCLQIIDNFVQDQETTTVLHNAFYDLGVLQALGVEPRNIEDTMVMAYLLQDEPQGLKPLSYRKLSVKMKPYADTVREAQIEKSLEYLLTVAGNTWPDPEPILEFRESGPHVKQPQNIRKKAIRILNDYGRDSSIDIVKRWNSIDDRKEVEDILGPMPTAHLGDIDFNDALGYACKDAIVTLGVYPILKERITLSRLLNAYRRDINIIPMVQNMTNFGIKINPRHFRELTEYFQDRMDEKQSEIENLYTQSTGESKSINIVSPKQVAEMLFKMKIFRFKNQSTSADSLDRIRSRHPVINLITEYRGLRKLQGTYTNTIAEKADSDNRVHSNFKTTRVVTGRLSSSNPNLHNQPKHGAEAVKIREGFIPEPGCVFLANDYKQIEMRLAAHMAQDKTMLRMLIEGKDLHSETASWIFNTPVDQVDKELHRQPAKSIGFGIIYCISGVGLQKQLCARGLNYTEQDCTNMISKWLEMYRGIADLVEESKSMARRWGYVTDIFGRRRLIPEVMSTNHRVVAAGLRQAVNARAQSGAQGIIKEAMVQLTPVYREYLSRGYIFRPLIQIHDDLLFEVQRDILLEVAPIIKQVMENAVKLSVPLPVDQETGENWGRMG